MQERPWLFDEQLIILKKWTPNICLDKVLFFVLVWIRLPSLHLKFWSKAILNKTASVIGVPLYLDKATTNEAKLNLSLIHI